LLRFLCDEGVSGFKISVLLLEGVLVMEEDVTVQILKASGLAEAQELVVNETILNGVEFVDVVDVVFDLVLDKILYEIVSVKGDDESDIPLSGECVVLNIGSEVLGKGRQATNVRRKLLRLVILLIKAQPPRRLLAMTLVTLVSHSLPLWRDLAKGGVPPGFPFGSGP